MTIRAKLFPALLATATFLALAIAAFGFVSLFTATDVIAERSVGPLVGPAMIMVTTVAYFLGLLWLVLLAVERRSPLAVIAAITLGSPLVYALTGAVIQLFATGLPAEFVIFFASHLVSMFSGSLAACALLIAVGFWLVSLAPPGRRNV